MTLSTSEGAQVFDAVKRPSENSAEAFASV
jgi:hypothetical protein